MTELSHILETDLSQHVFIVGTIIFMLVAAAAVMVIAGRVIGDRARSEKPRRAPLVIGTVVAIAAIAGGFQFIGSSSSDVAPRNQTIDVADIMQRVDTQSLPVQTVSEPF